MNALVERLDVELGAGVLDPLEVDAALAPRDLQCGIGRRKVEGADVLAPRRYPEMLAVAAVLEEGRHVAADGNGAVLDEAHLVIEVEVALVLGHGAQIGRRLLVVLLAVLELVALDGAHGARRETNAAKLGRDLEVPDFERLVGDVIADLRAATRQHAPEVLDVHGAGQALAAQDGIVVEPLRHASVGKYVREVQLSPGLEHAEYLLEKLLLEGREVDHAVGDDDVDVLAGNRGHVLDVALDELDVALGQTEALDLRGLVAARELELARRHVDADDVAFRPHELGGDEDVATRAAAQIEHRGAFERWRQRASAAVEVRDDIRVELREDVEHVLGGSRGGAGARVGAQVLAIRKRLAVVLAHHGADVDLCHAYLPSSPILKHSVKNTCASRLYLSQTKSTASSTMRAKGRDSHTARALMIMDIFLCLRRKGCVCSMS